RHNKAVRGISDEALRRLRAHLWPGNIRELEHCIESAVALCPAAELSMADLPLPTASHEAFLRKNPPAQPPPTDEVKPSRVDPAGLQLPFGLSLADVEKRYIQQTVERFGGNRSEAARALGIGRNTLLRKLRET
ncbi:MAG TPA: helix-turn-helix domain-containing protein, partial [Pseudomonadota bacterium]|nr:helix-turn-helix domain-containing protein [Pseudomonadota bacterium]